MTHRRRAVRGRRTRLLDWELSADGANASRRELVSGGMDESKVLRVLGLASTQNLNQKDPMDPENRRA